MSTTLETPVLIDRTGALGRLRLNRPQALNSLTLDMVRRISQALDHFEKDPDIAAVLVTGEGDRAFCAGGDIRALYEAGRAGEALPETFWREEYALNARIDRFPKPYIAVMDGITMGGGVGLSSHGSHRIVTERTRLAMPETGIGFFPDVGGTWLLGHGPGEIGTYLGLTGEQAGASDAIYAGLADTFVPSQDLGGLTEALTALPAGIPDDAVTALIERFAKPVEPTPMQEDRAEIDRIFKGERIEEIVVALEQSASEFLLKAHRTILAKSPTSLKLTLRLLRLARTSASLEECLEREFAAGHKVIAGHDFYEGVRAAVIDKDRNPHWSPSRLEQVSDSDIEAYLSAATEPVFPARSDA
ncbi:enoyl-CoA hydratase/isomerase family protein [Telmatospirillum sp.]|uniref:enoyl-CoA hydratase/isomerase family protein n=1 Tax=Telmatospirillum sp. TaxID=2079197 RepID=UPI0028456B1C|nr:enoyl-CoA hydratase/isomerase family protein [Telmatospirillum sp.]MDR3440514.1 enoyl-CoA hydratase/isomerase family protein [Telmatospirillum sp.]